MKMKKLKSFFKKLYNLIIGEPETFDVEVHNLSIKNFGKNCVEYGTLQIYSANKVRYDYSIKNLETKKEIFGTLYFRIKVYLNFVTFLEKRKTFLKGRMIKEANGDLVLFGPGYFRGMPLLENNYLLFEKLWDIPDFS